MAKSLHITMFVSVLVFCASHLTSCQEFNQYSQELPEDAKISPTSDFDNYVEPPEESPAEEGYSPAMEYEIKFGHHYTDKELGFFKVCIQKLKSDCGYTVFDSWVYETTQILTKECCRNLLKIDKDCYVGLAQMILSSYEYRDIASKAIPRSKQTWNNCVRRVENQIGSPMAFEELN